MPFSASTIRCRVDPDLDAALFDFQERLGEQYLRTQELLSGLTVIGDSVDASLFTPLRSSLDNILATRNLSTSDMEDVIGLVTGPTRQDFESSFGDRYGLTIINGKVVPKGNVDVSSLKVMSRLIGGLSDVFRYIPELNSIPVTTGSSSGFNDETTFPPRFLFVTTYTKTTTVPATKCDPGYTSTSEVTAAIERSLTDSSTLSGIPVDELTSYVFWLGDPDPVPRNRNRARSLGLTPDQFLDMVSLRSSDSLKVFRIKDPGSILRVILSFGPDTDEALTRIETPITLFPSPFDVIEDMTDLIGRSSGGSSPSGLRDLSSPASALISSIDIEGTFGLEGMLSFLESQSSLTSTEEASAFVAGVVASLKSQLSAINFALPQAQEFLKSKLSELSNLESVVYNLLGDRSTGLMDCVFGVASSIGTSYAEEALSSAASEIPSSFGSPGTPGTAGSSSTNHMDRIVDLIENQASSIREFMNTLNELFSSLSDISCAGSFLSGTLTAFPFLPDALIECASQAAVDSGFEIPAPVIEVIGIFKQVMDFMGTLFEFAISNNRNLALTAKSLSLSIRSEMTRNSSSSSTSATGASPAGGCTPPEALRLAQLLQQRALAAFADVGDSIA